MSQLTELLSEASTGVALDAAIKYEKVRNLSAVALIREADLRRMAKIAKETGVRVEVEVDGKLIRVAPDHPVPKMPDEETLPDDFSFF